MSTALQSEIPRAEGATGEFVDLDGDRFYVIRNVDRMAPFFTSIVSSSDHWLFVSSTGGLTAGRVSPDNALFPYITDDKIHESGLHTGPRTMLRVRHRNQWLTWEPFNQEQNQGHSVSRHLYKNLTGNKLNFEEIHHELRLRFRYSWATSERYGFVRTCELKNLGETPIQIEWLDGLQNILPAGTPRFTQTNSSNLVDAYKWTEYDPKSGLALFTLYSGISDRAEPSECLYANTAFCLGLDAPVVLLSSEQLGAFRQGRAIEAEHHKRGVRGSLMVSDQAQLAPGASATWQFVANTRLSQPQVVALRRELAEPEVLAERVARSVADGSDELARIMAKNDSEQLTAEEHVTVHHYANVMFNVLRGGYFSDDYEVDAADFVKTIRHFNRPVAKRNESLLQDLPERVPYPDLLKKVAGSGDLQLLRLTHEYLPISFGRRHGDPSRPWNLFSIRIKDDAGRPLYWYEGNWRDIFQNWEALALSYPEFAENMVAKFVNASTMDGYNPYRITKAGIDWEVEDPEDPWSYIGYWGDHQIIYLEKLLEVTQHFHPRRLGELLHQPVFAYANVPYRIAPFTELLDNPKSTVTFDEGLAGQIDERVRTIGADGKLVLTGDHHVYQVTLLEKLLVPLLSKLGNLVVEGGIWMNTQRPEWNDANNAIVGHGLSMVTLYYLRRYVCFLAHLIESEADTIELSLEVGEWLTQSLAALEKSSSIVGKGNISPATRLELLKELGEPASNYRKRVYQQGGMSGKGRLPLQAAKDLLSQVLRIVDLSLAANRRSDGLYHAYNLMIREPAGIQVEHLYPMLEGQVSALSAGALETGEVIDVLEALFASDIYRADQDSFMLYPDRELPGFLEKNRIPAEAISKIPLLAALLEDGNEQIVVQDAEGSYRFNSSFRNVADLDAALAELAERYGRVATKAREPLRSLFESVFNHRAFTGRSGTMFGFEGLGCIYWHMVAKLLLAVQENFFSAVEKSESPEQLEKLGELYYRVRAGLGFNKTPAEYGAFPTDPYSHTPKHAGARQPGMTGQVKEEILTRFGELGLRAQDGQVHFKPALLRRQEFLRESAPFRYLDVAGRWQTIEVPAGGLAFTWCQVPVIYRLSENSEFTVTAQFEGGEKRRISGAALERSLRQSILRRDGRVQQLLVTFGGEALLGGPREVVL